MIEHHRHASEEMIEKSNDCHEKWNVFIDDAVTVVSMQTWRRENNGHESCE
jgi:hypothetical protein